MHALTPRVHKHTHKRTLLHFVHRLAVATTQDCGLDSYEVRVPFNKKGEGYDAVSKCLKTDDEDGLQAMIVAKASVN